METLDGRVEVDESQRHAADALDREVDPLTGVGDETAFRLVNVERIGEEIHGVKADPLDLLESVGSILAGLSKGRVDEAELMRPSCMMFSSLGKE